MKYGKFTGDVSAKWLKHRGDDRDMELLQNFRFTDAKGVTWDAPKGSVVNGASIPSALWATVGPPFVGDYRRASVIHDVACENRKQPHEAVHRMFYDAMRADGVGWTRANVMYQAVKRFGPRWGSTGRLQRKKTSVSDEQVLEFAKAVEIAAKGTDQEEGLEAVEIKAEKILAEDLIKSKPRSSGKSREKGRPRSTPGRAKPVSRVRILSEKESEQAGSDVIAEMLDNISPAVKKQLSGTQLLSSFRSIEVDALAPNLRSLVSSQDLAASASADAAAPTIGDAEDGLTEEDRLTLVDQALVLIEQNYVHRPLKESLHAINPVQKLKLLREELLREESERAFEGDLGFHRQLLSIFLSTRDLHTNYVLPSPFRETTAYLPFLVEDYFDPDDQPHQRRFLVTRVVGDDLATSFRAGVEILRWNGVPIERAVEINGERFAGSNREASRARGIETLTVRPLMQSLPPQEDFVLVEYRGTDGEVAEVRFDWMVFSPDTGGLAAMQQLDALEAVSQGIDIEQAMVRWAKRILFAPEAVAASAKMARRKQPTKAQGLQSFFPEVLEARNITTDSGEYGYLRIRSFSVSNADSFVREVIRLIEQLPEAGLVIDVRGNGGGLILAGEQLLQLFTPKEIEPTLFQLLNTPLNRRLVDDVGFLSPWRPSMRHAVQAGAEYTQGFPITPPAKANDIGQRYHGPVALITDALCYSTTDIFAAGFQDHEVGTILGIDNNTGAGGANVWPHDLLLDLLDGNSQSPYEKLPSNTGMRVSIRRTIRVGLSNGTVLEDFGVMPDELHPMTRDDLLNDNVDLLERATEILSEQPPRRLSLKFVDQGQDGPVLKADTLGIDRLDIFDSDRPLGSVDVNSNETEIQLTDVTQSRLRVLGYEDGNLVASRNV